MNKAKLIPIDSINLDREISPYDDGIPELAESIRKLPGIRIPVSVTEDLHLIDGLRRIRALQTLGYTDVPAITVHTFEEICDLYVKTRKYPTAARPISVAPERIWQFYLATDRFRRERTARLKRRPASQRDQPINIRKVIVDTLDIGSEAVFSATTSMYKRFTGAVEPHRKEHYLELQRLLESGEITIFQARGRMDHTGDTEFVGDVVKPDEQRRILVTAIAQYSGTTSAMRLLGELHPDINPVELTAYIKGLEREATNMRAVIISLRKRVQSS